MKKGQKCAKMKESPLAQPRRNPKSILVTGGAGFVGCNFIHYLFGLSPFPEKFSDAEFGGKVICLDALTYAGRLERLADIDAAFGSGAPQGKRRYFFERGDICCRATVERVFREYGIDAVAHFAAESHVDRSIAAPEAFVRTNVLGAFTLLDVARELWREKDGSYREGVIFHHVSTDEVYGELGDTGLFSESSPYGPGNPYAASKAAADHLVLAYARTYALPATLSNCSNNYGPFQLEEKLLPQMILAIARGETLPVYGDGRNIRDWIYVEDHCRAIWQIIRRGRAGQKYNIGGENEWENIRLVNKLIGIEAEELEAEGFASKSPDEMRQAIRFVEDRPGHDRRYAIDCSKIRRELGWERKMPFDEGLRATVRWYLSHMDWAGSIISGERRGLGPKGEAH